MSNANLPRQRLYRLDATAILPGELLSLHGDSSDPSRGIYRAGVWRDGDVEAFRFDWVDVLEWFAACGVELPTDATVADVRQHPTMPYVIEVRVRSAEFERVRRGEEVPAWGNEPFMQLLRPKKGEGE